MLRTNLDDSSIIDQYVQAVIVVDNVADHRFHLIIFRDIRRHGDHLSTSTVKVLPRKLQVVSGSRSDGEFCAFGRQVTSKYEYRSAGTPSHKTNFVFPMAFCNF